MQRRQPTPSIRVLVVDDNPDHRFLCAVALDATDPLACVADACDGRTASAEARRVQPDVVVLDLKMPGVDGLAAIELLREAAPEAAIVVWTNADDRTRLRAQEAGATSVVSKLEPISRLVDEVLRAAS